MGISQINLNKMIGPFNVVHEIINVKCNTKFDISGISSVGLVALFNILHISIIDNIVMSLFVNVD